MEYINGKKIDEIGDGHIVMENKPPYIIDDEEELKDILLSLEYGNDSTKFKIVEDIQGEVLRKTIVERI